MQVKRAVFVRTSMVALGCALGFAGAAFGKAVPAGTVTFDEGRCTAKFVRSASGIVNETHRECEGDQNPWIDADVRLQFRPLDGRPNATCDPEGLVTTFVFSNTDPALAAYFPEGTQYNACVYLENSVVASGTLDSADVAGATSEPAPLPGTYRVCVTGTWTNRGGMDVFDAEYVSQDNWTTVSDGLPAGDPFSSLGPNLGDVTVNGAFVDWGTYSTAHRYCTNVTLDEGETVTLAVFDGDPATGTANPDWYADNAGTLQYTVTYAGP